MQTDAVLCSFQGRAVYQAWGLLPKVSPLTVWSLTLWPSCLVTQLRQDASDMMLPWPLKPPGTPPGSWAMTPKGFVVVVQSLSCVCL